MHRLDNVMIGAGFSSMLNKVYIYETYFIKLGLTSSCYPTRLAIIYVVPKVSF